MKNLPEKIYLQIGEEADIDDYLDFNELVGVSWCSDKIEESDVEFIRSDIAIQKTINSIIAFANWYDKQTSTEESQNEPWMNETNAKSFLSYYNSRKAQTTEK